MNERRSKLEQNLGWIMAFGFVGVFLGPTLLTAEAAAPSELR